MTRAARLRWMRALLGLTMLAIVAALTIVLLRREPISPPPPPPRVLTEEEEAAGASQASVGFDFTRTDEGEADFLLRADRVLGMEGETYVLERPALELRHQDGTWTRASADRGSFEPGSEEGLLEGNARGATSSGLELQAEALRYREGGDGIDARGRARFSRRGLRGSGEGMRYDATRGLLSLERDVHLEGAPDRPGAPWTLDSRTLRYQVDSGDMRTGPFTLDGAEGTLRGRRLHLELDPDTSAPRRMTADGDAELWEIAAAPDGERARLAGDRIVVEPDPDARQPRRLEAVGNATLVPGATRGRGARRVDAGRIEIRRGAQARRRLAADGEVRLALDGATLESATLRAELGPGAELVSGTAAGEVRYEGEEGSARGADAEFEEAGERIVLTGAPGAPPLLITPEQRLTARRILVERGRGMLLADEDVRTVSRGRHASGGLFEEGEPVYASADFLRASRDEDLAVYQGAVRIWQVDGLLQADRVEIRRQAGILQAEGRVLTRSLLEGEDGPRWVQGSAERFQYREADGVAAYRGGAELDLGSDRVEAESIDVRLDESRAIREVLAEGAVRVRFQDHRGVGDRLEYRPRDGTALLHGVDRLAEAQDPVNQRLVRGQTLTFQLSDGRMQIESAPGGRTWITLSPGQEGTVPEPEEPGGRP